MPDDLPKYDKPPRPGIVTFAAIISFVAGFMYLSVSVSEFGDSHWLVGHTKAYSLFSAHQMTWGIWDVVIGLIAVAAGFLILKGSPAGAFLGVAGAGISMIRWFFYIPLVPMASLVIIVLDLMVMYAVTSHGDWFQGDVPLPT